MKRIEDAPKELQKMFSEIWNDISRTSGSTASYCEHFFLKGFDTAMATGGLPQRPKRTISRVIPHDSSLYALSSDGKLFMKNGHLLEWVMLPDLPKED